MNGLSKQDHHLSTQDPLYYAPGSLRKRSMSPLTPSRETRSEPLSSSASFNQFETVLRRAGRTCSSPKRIEE